MVTLILNCLNVAGQVFNMYDRLIIPSYPSNVNSLWCNARLTIGLGKSCLCLILTALTSKFSPTFLRFFLLVPVHSQPPIKHLLSTTIRGGTRAAVNQNIA